MRRALLTLARPLALAAVLTAAEPAAAQFSLLGLQNSLVQFVLSQVSVEGTFEITADGVQEDEDGKTVLAGIKIADKDGVWFEAESAQLTWNAKRILRGEVEITDMALTGMRVLRTPTPPTVEVKEGSELDQAQFDPFAWPRSPITVRVESMRLVRAFIAEGVLASSSLAFEATGSFRDEGQIQSLKLDVTRTDAVEGAIGFEYVRDFSDESLKLAIQAREAAGGLVAEMGGLPTSSASFVNLDASGPLVDWKLTLAAETENVMRVDGAASVNARAPIAVDASLALVPGPELSQEARTALGERADLDLKVREDEGGLVRIETGEFRSPAVQASATGTYARASGEMDFDLGLQAGAVMASVAEGVDFERIAFDGALKGVPTDFRASGALTLAGLTTAPADIGSAALEIAAELKGDALTFTADGDAERVRLDRLGPDLLGATKLDIRAVWGMESQLATLEAFAIDSPLLSVSAKGEADVAKETAALDYALTTPDLAPVAAAYDQDAGGDLKVEGRAEGPFAAIHLTGTATAGDLRFQQQDYGAVSILHDVTVGEIIAGTASVEAAGSPYGPAKVAAGFSLDGDALSVRDLRAEAMGAIVEGAAEVDLATTLATGALTLGVADLSTFSDFAGAPLLGSVSGKVELTAPEGRQDVNLAVAAHAVSGFDATLARADVTAAVRDATGAPSVAFSISGDEAAVFAPAVEAAADQAAETTQEAAPGSATDQAVDAAAAAASEAAAEDPAAAIATLKRIEATGEATDLLGTPALKAKVTATEAASPKFQARLARAVADIDLVELTGAPSGTITLRAEQAEADEPQAAMEVLEVTVQGRDLLAAPTAKLKGFAEGLSAAGAEVARLDFDATGEDLLGAGRGEVNLTAASIRAGGAAVSSITATAKGEGFTTAPSGTLTAKANGIDAGGATIASATLDAEGRDLVANPTGKARLVASTIDAAGVATLSKLEAKADGDAKALTFSVAGDGKTAKDKPLALRVNGKGALAGETQTITVSTLSLKAAKVEIAQQGPLTVALQGGETAVKGLNISLPGGGLTGAATLSDAGARGKLGLEVGDLAALGRAFGAPVKSGTVSVAADFDTRASSPRAKVTAQGRRLAFAELDTGDKRLAVDLEADWNGRRLTADGVLKGPFGGQGVQVTAALPLVPNGMFPAPPANAQLDASVVWKGRVETIWPLLPLPDHVLTGDLDVDLKLVGPLDGPKPAGRIQLTGGAYQNLETGTILRNLEVRSGLRGGGGITVSLSADDGAKGPIRGQVELKGETVSAHVTADNAVLVRRDDVTAAVSADIRAEGPTAAPAVTGTITIDRAEVRLVNATPPSLPTLGEVEIKGAPPKEVEETSEGGPTLDLKIRAPGDIFVRGRGLTSEWRVDLAVTGYASAPEIRGEVSGVRGTLDFLGRDFDLTRSSVRFQGGSEINPLLDVAFEHEREDILGRIAVRGYVSDPQLAFESVPALPEDEVLPRVIFGSPRQSLTAAQGIQLAAGVATLASGGEGALGRVRSAVGLDVLSVDAGGDGTAIKAGQNVADGVFVGVKQPVDGGATAVEVEVEVFEHVTVDAETAGDDGSSVGVNWKMDW